MANKRKARDASASDFELVGVRLPQGLVAKLDARLESMKRDTPGAQLHRSDVIRNLLVTALDSK